MLAAPPGDAVPAWLQSLPAAPEYHPTAAEFADPVAYMLKIEPEASRFGICKIVPPLPAPPRAGTVTRLEASFADANAAAGEAGPTFTTRRQQVGLSPRSRRPACRAVWHSGERYTLSAFESKARLFARSVLPPHPKKPGARRAPLETEALFWRACAGRPTTVEYGNDMPGSGFAALGEGDGGAAAPRDVGETEWNMRRAPRAQGSLLRCMQRDVAGVTSPMVYVAMLFSWFAWHVEDHELHSLNYLHLGEPKTWYGVPRDAMLAFEDVVRVHGYSEEVNAIMTFEILNEKTTVMSPEVLLSAGVPCCRLVQNPGDFVITFPGAYHSGFSHGFNCGEATNIATPCWLPVAREAAIRRASTNCGPMVSHYQLLYELALSFLPRMPKNCNTEPRSSRLRDKMKNEGEMMVKETFVASVIQNNNLLSILVDKGSCIIVPEVADPLASFSKAMAPEVNVKQRLSAPCISQQAVEEMLVEDVIVDERATIGHFGGSESANKTSSSACHRKKLYETKRGKLEVASFPLSTSEMQNGVIEKEHQGGGLLDQGRLPCVQCGILSFACGAIIQPGDAAVRFIMSRDCSSLDGNHGEISESDDISNWRSKHCEMVPQQGQASGTDDNWLSNIRMAQVSDRCRQLYSSNDNGCTSALGLLASAYEASDSEEEIPKDILTDGDKNDEANQCTAILETPNSCLGTFQHNGTDIHLYEEKCEARITSLMKPTEHNTKLLTRASFDTDISCYKGLGEPEPSYEQCSWYLFSVDDPATSGGNASSSNHTTSGKASLESDLTTIFKYNRDSSRMHVFCLEHALETWKQLQKIGGANIMLLCHPEYPRAELQAKVVAEELGMNYEWKHINFMEATKEDIGRIQLAWQDEDAEPTSGDWAVKMGINMYYSAKQSKSPLYSKQIPYNAIIYKAFGQENPDSLAEDTDQSLGGMKKRVVSGRWCGKVWTSNQVHPLLAHEPDERSHEDIGYNEVSDWESKFSSNSRQNRQGELTKRSTLISSALSKTSFGRRRGKSYDKPRTKNRRTTDDEATLLHSGLGKNSEAIPKQQTKFSDYNEQEYDGIEEAPDTQPYQQPKLQNLNMKSRSKKRTGEKKNRRVQEDLYEDNDVEHLIDIDSGDEAAVGTLDRSPQQKLGSMKIKLDGMKTKSKLKMQGTKRKSTKSQAHGLSDGDNEAEFSCDVEGCTMSFSSHHDLALHKRNICPLKGCKKKFFSHKYLLQHRKVHMDERPLKCPWKGCKKTFKWPWARTEHIRVHTGARPYVCKELGCGQTFRFVSDFSRHKRKTGHSCDKRKKAST